MVLCLEFLCNKLICHEHDEVESIVLKGITTAEVQTFLVYYARHKHEDAQFGLVLAHPVQLKMWKPHWIWIWYQTTSNITYNTFPIDIKPYTNFEKNSFIMELRYGSKKLMDGQGKFNMPPTPSVGYDRFTF